jgi:D-ribose pyranose/furanose isomerase RbsD
MLKTGCINPEILAELAKCTHTDQVFVCTGNMKFFYRETKAKVVYVGVSVGLPSTTDVLKALKDTVNFEKMELIEMPEGYEVYNEFQEIYPDIEVESYGIDEYLEKLKSNDLALIIVTGDARRNANALLTVYK